MATALASAIDASISTAAASPFTPQVSQRKTPLSGDISHRNCIVTHDTYGQQPCQIVSELRSFQMGFVSLTCSDDTMMHLMKQRWRLPPRAAPLPISCALPCDHFARRLPGM
jgi:hypothetical protein